MCDCQTTTPATSAVPDKPTTEDEKSGCGCGPSCGCNTAPDADRRQAPSAA